MANRAYFYGLGKRKTARATVKLFPGGKGDVTVNGEAVREWSNDDLMARTILQPLTVLGVKSDYDVEIRVSGGGQRAQSESARLGLSRALVKKDATTRGQLKEEGFMTRDPRKKERKKPGLKKARRAPQFSKR